jgi:hypothetical protein
MTKRFRNLLLVVIVLGLTAWLILFGVERLFYHEGPNYSRIEEGLYMGGLVEEPPPGTQAVLNVCEQADPYPCEVSSWEAIPDTSPAPSLDWLRQRVEFVDANRRAGRTVYVHCFAGASRSGLVVVAYEMLKHHWTRDEALAFVRSQRPVTRPNPAFMELLLEWERVVKGQAARAVTDSGSAYPAWPGSSRM